MALHLNQVVSEKETQLERAYKRLEAGEPPDDEVTNEIVKAYQKTMNKISSEVMEEREEVCDSQCTCT